MIKYKICSGSFFISEKHALFLSIFNHFKTYCGKYFRLKNGEAPEPYTAWKHRTAENQLCIYVPLIHANFAVGNISELCDPRSGKSWLYIATGALICGIFVLAVSALPEHLELRIKESFAQC